VLTALCVTTLWGAGPRQYAPHWQVGDWWVVKVWQQFGQGSYLWHLERYDVAGITKVGSSDCFVMKIRVQSSKGHLALAGSDFYVRRDDWRVVRRVTTRVYKDTLIAVDTANYPHGLFGPYSGEPRLPRLPLKLAGRADTLFKLRQRNDSSVLMRELPRVADTALVNRLITDGDTTGRHVVRPTGVVYQVRSEMESDLKSDTEPGAKRITQSFQLWCKDQPWRIYEELVQYDGPKPARWVAERTWLIASGHSDK
jgi:hypothetical protein